ncbi:MAG: rod shape-determining protein MreC [Parcubacteria group bacterium]|nr:rod shape-determining protein MreC [Parcubacteria group bacterium]
MKLRGSRRGRRRLFIVFLLVALASIFTFRGSVARIIEPGAEQFVRSGTWIYDQIFWFISASEITPYELNQLYVQRDKLAVNATEFATLQIEHEEVLEILHFVNRTNTVGVVARVLAKSISGITSQFVIDVGSDDGVKAGDPVIVGDGIFLGKLTTVGRSTSTVTTLTDSKNATAVAVFNGSRTIGVATGSIGDLLEIAFIPADEDLQPNMLVVTSGLESTIPSGLLIGLVNTVQEDPSSPFQTAIIEPLADVRRVSQVFVIPNQDYD